MEFALALVMECQVSIFDLVKALEFAANPLQSNWEWKQAFLIYLHYKVSVFLELYSPFPNYTSKTVFVYEQYCRFNSCKIFNGQWTDVTPIISPLQ